MGCTSWLSPLLKSCRFFRFHITLLTALFLCLSPSTASAQTLTFTGSSPAVNFGSVNVCAPTNPAATCSATMTLTYKVTAGGVLGPIQVVTGGAPNLDFTLADGSTCIGNVITGQTCTVNVRFAPKYAGSRPGGVLITNRNVSAALVSTLIYGFGVGPQIGFNLGNPISVALQGVGTSSVASDSAGNFYALGASADAYGAPTALVKLPAGGGPQVSVPLGTLTQAYAMAVDGAGDLFLVDANYQVVELPAGGGAQITLPITGLSTSNPAINLAVDSAGNLFVTTGGPASGGLHGAVLELPAGSASQIALPFSGLDYPTHVAVDNAGDVFVSETPAAQNYAGVVLELTHSGTQKTVIPASLTATNTVDQIGGVAVDELGDLFASDYDGFTGIGQLLEVPSNGESPVVVANYSNAESALAVSPTGDLFVTDFAGFGLLRRSQPPTLRFSEVGVGTTGTQPLTISNNGNAPLTISTQFSSTNFDVQSTAPADCLAAIPASSICTVQVGYSPTTEGRQSGKLTLETNGALNPIVPLEGNTGIAVPVLSLPSGVYTTTQTVSITDASPEATIYYTTDGTMPTASSTPYTGPISVTTTERLTAVAIVPQNPPSPPASAAYTIQSASSADSFDFSQGLASTHEKYVPITLINAHTDGFRLQLTTGLAANLSASSFYINPINIQSFTTYFTFQLTNAMADGFTFTIQNDNAYLVEGPGSALGYQGMPKSVAIKFDLHDNAGEGSNSTGLYLNGAAPTVPAIDLTGSGIDLHSGDIIDTRITYDGKNLVLTLTDTTSLKTWSHSFTVDIPATVGGNTAYVGFTAATGRLTADQEILSWTYIAAAPVQQPPPPPVPAVPPVPGYAAGFNAVGMTTNGSTEVPGTALQLTDGGTLEAASAFYATPQNIQSFTSDFTFQLVNPLAGGYFPPTNPIADGITLTIQNAGAYALGSLGGGLGYTGIGQSVALKFDLYNNAGEGSNSTGLYINGAAPTVPAVDLTGTGIDLHSGNPIAAHITYDGTNLHLTLTDTITLASWSHSFAINIPATVGGNTAYIGFTGGTGRDTAIQQILSWTFSNP